MKIKDDYLVRQVADGYAIIPVGQAIEDGRKIIRVNSMGFAVAKALLEDCSHEEMLDEVFAAQDIPDKDRAQFEKDVTIFCDSLKGMDVIDE